MTNTQIIYNAAQAHGFTPDQLNQLLAAYNGDLPFHTIPEWSRRGYHVKANETPLFTCDLWKHTSKPSRAAVQAAQEAGEDVPENSPHFYKKFSYLYSFAQVEKNAAAPDLDTIKARLQDLPGLTLTVKGAKTASPIVWLTGDTDTHADAIKAVGGIWSNKKSAYWVKPSAAPVPSMEEDAPAAPAPTQSRPTAILPPVRLALPAPARLLALPVPKADPDPTPAPVPGSWKKCSFYTIRRDEKTKRPTAQQVDGYTDDVYNYYASGNKTKQWHAIHPVYGLSVAYADSRKAAQEMALERAEMVRRFTDNADAQMQKYAAMIKEAQDGGNLSLF